MRTLLAPSMLNVIVDNLKKGNAEGRLFEMAPVYLAKELPISEHPHERQTLCIGAFGPEEDFFTVKGAMEALAAGFDLTFTYERETTPVAPPRHQRRCLLQRQASGRLRQAGQRDQRRAGDRKGPEGQPEHLSGRAGL